MGRAECVCLALPTPTVEQATVTQSRRVREISSTTSAAMRSLQPYTPDSLRAETV